MVDVVYGGWGKWPQSKVCDVLEVHKTLAKTLFRFDLEEPTKREDDTVATMDSVWSNIVFSARRCCLDQKGSACLLLLSSCFARTCALCAGEKPRAADGGVRVEKARNGLCVAGLRSQPCVSSTSTGRSIFADGTYEFQEFDVFTLFP